MRKFVVGISVLGLFILILSSLGFAQGNGKFKYVGSAKCKMCHNSAKKGAQFKVWSSSRHANAYATLATPEAKKIAKEKGIEDPQKSAACLTCHVTGAGAPKDMFAASFKVETEGVGCETCHGPGSEFKSMKIMKDIRAGKIDAKTVGFTKYKPEDCKSCHNPKSPTYKEFKYEEFWKKIEHGISAN